jgi:hypothetical protein
VGKIDMHSGVILLFKKKIGGGGAGGNKKLNNLTTCTVSSTEEGFQSARNFKNSRIFISKCIQFLQTNAYQKILILI